MKLGAVLFEAKLTEADFQIQKPRLSRDIAISKDVFECRSLPRPELEICSYQLLRNVLAAYA